MSITETIVTKKVAMAPPETFISVPDGELVSYFQGTLSKTDQESVSKLHEMFEGLCTAEYSKLRRALEQDFTYFSDASTGKPHTCGGQGAKHVPSAEDLNEQESRFLSNFLELLRAGQYSLLSQSVWNACKDEDFLMTLPVVINYDAMDDKLLPGALWPQHPEVPDQLPTEIADRVLIFHRGIDVAKMRGMFIMHKVDLIITFWILQPVFAIFAWIMSKLGVTRFMPRESPSYMSNFASADNQGTDTTQPLKAPAHKHSISVERKTFARVFPTGASVFKQLFKTVELREASFKDVVVLYRKAIPDTGLPPVETDIVIDAEPAFLQRNVFIKRFRDIPLADLDIVFPDFKIFMPPQVAVNMAVTGIGALVAIVAAVRGGMDTGVLMTTLSMLGTRAFQVYTTANFQKTNISRSLQKILYERSLGSQYAVLSTLTEEMAKQRIRELLVCYCILLQAGGSLKCSLLDQKIESFLAHQFGVAVDFACNEALETLTKWGVVVADPNGDVRALPMPEALKKIDAVWDSLFDFSGTGSGAVGNAISGITSKIALTNSLSRRRAANASQAAVSGAMPPAPPQLGTPGAGKAGARPVVTVEGVMTGTPETESAKKRGLFHFGKKSS